MGPTGSQITSRLKVRNVHERLPVQISMKLSTMLDNHLTKLLNRRYGETIDLLMIRDLQPGQQGYHVHKCLLPGRF